MSSRLTDQAWRLYHVANELVKQYQFRDRNDTVCYGITVLQCYLLEALESGPMYMKDVAQALNVANSTTTRTSDALVAMGLIDRQPGKRDRRSVQIRLTEEGKAMLATIRRDIVAGNEVILEDLPEDVRDQVIDTIEKISEFVKGRMANS